MPLDAPTHSTQNSNEIKSPAIAPSTPTLTSDVVIEMPRGRLIGLFAGLLIAMLTSALDQTIVSTALPTIVGDLGGANHMLWVVTAEVLAMTVSMPVFGKLGDLMGRKRLYLFSLVLLAAGSTVCALATSMPMLIAGRAVQGVGGGGLTILAQAITADVVPARVRGAYMGVMGLAFAVPTVIGPFLGGYFTDVAGWRWAFWINLPLVALSLAAAVTLIPTDARRARLSQFDAAGATLVGAALVAVTLLTSLDGSVIAWNSPASLALAAAAVICSALFIVVEKRAAEPIIPLGLFRNRNFVLTTLAGLFAMLALMGALSYLPTYFQIAHGLNATQSGLMDLPASIASGIAPVLVGVLVSRTGRYKGLMVTSFAISAVAVALLAAIDAHTSLLFIGVALFVLGFGIGMSLENLVLIAQNEFPASMVGTVTAANNFFREVGTTLGAALVGALFTANLSQTLTSALESLGGADALGFSASTITPALVRELPQEAASAVASAYADALAPVFLAVVPLMLVSMVLMMCLKKTPLATRVE